MGLLQKIFSKFSPEKKGFSVDEFIFSQFCQSVFGQSFGVSVTPVQILQIVAVFGAVNIRGATLSMFPIKLVEKKGSARLEFDSPNLERIFKISPDGERSTVAWLKAMESTAVLHGESNAFIERNVFGEATRLVKIEPYAAKRRRDRSGKLYYEVYGEKWSADDILHIVDATLDGLSGLAPSKYLSTSLSLARAIDIENGKFFEKGCTAGKIFSTDQFLTPQQRAEIEAQLKKYEGLENAGRSLFIDGGTKLTQTRMSNHDAQTAEMKKSVIREVSTWSGVPSHKLGDAEKANYASQEEANNDFFINTMLGRVLIWEGELKKLFRPEDRLNKSVNFNYRVFLRGKPKDRAEFYWKMWQMGAYTANDILAFEDMAPRADAGGNAYYTPLNMKGSNEPKEQQ